MRIAASVALGIIVLVSATPALAQARNCTTAERAAANAELLLIQNDAARRQSILGRPGRPKNGNSGLNHGGGNRWQLKLNAW